jgi:hypothetical protein
LGDDLSNRSGHSGNPIRRFHIILFWYQISLRTRKWHCLPSDIFDAVMFDDLKEKMEVLLFNANG